MKVSSDKYRDIMEDFVELMDTINLEVPSEIKPFYDLYRQIKDNPKVDESLFEEESVIKGATTFENACNYELKKITNDDFEARLILFVPAAKIKDFPNKMLFSEYRIYITYVYDENDKLSHEKNMILSALATDNKIIDLFAYISRMKNIIVREEQIEDFYKFKRIEDGKIIKYMKQLEMGTRKEEAEKTLKEAYNLFEKIILELRVGLGVV